MSSSSAAALLPAPSAKHLGRLTVVLDLDETLVHSKFRSGAEYRQAEDRKEVTTESDFQVVLESGETADVYLRPGLFNFIEKGSEFFEFVIFTAALSVYAKPVLDRLDPENKFSHRLYREATVTYRGQPFVKDVSLLGRDMRRTILIDNNPFACIASPDNSMPILSFYDDQSDCELDKALALLMEMRKMEDIRPYMRKQFFFRQRLNQMLDWKI